MALGQSSNEICECHNTNEIPSHMYFRYLTSLYSIVSVVVLLLVVNWMDSSSLMCDVNVYFMKDDERENQK
jgi:hypothetical protein